MTDIRIPQDVAIRVVVRSDLDGLREWYGPQRDDSFRRSFERHRAGEVVYLVAELDGVTVGHLGIDLVRTPDVAWLWQFGVREPLQGRGIGSEMVRYAEEVARERSYHVAEIAAETDNPRARALYERLGYTLRGEEDGEWILRKDL